ncbi:MAG TPA: DUF6252 family protein [Flavobacteriaceae bacterium]|nr:DUF6252 family protein [Flavobacteriaceae bacterium]
MKKYFIPVLLLLLLVSCSDDIETNTPSMQGQTSFGFFHDLDAKVYTNEDGSMTIAGEDGSKKLNLTLQSISAGQEYELGGSSLNVAEYTSNSGVFYSTDSLGEGTIKISSVDQDGVFGSFGFNARVNGHTGDTLNVSQGALFGIPMAEGSLNPDDDIDVPMPDNASEECMAAMFEYYEAFQAFNNAGFNDEPSDVMQQKCTELKTAIQNAIDVCEEAEDILQGQYDMLDCSADNWDDWEPFE